MQWRVVTDGGAKRDACSDVDAALELRRRRHPGLDVETQIEGQRNDGGNGDEKWTESLREKSVNTYVMRESK